MGAGLAQCLGSHEPLKVEPLNRRLCALALGQLTPKNVSLCERDDIDVVVDVTILHEKKQSAKTGVSSVRGSRGIEANQSGSRVEKASDIPRME